MDKQESAFEKAARGRRPSPAAEFFYFLRQNKKWWLIPILAMTALLAALCFFAGTGAAPFIYTMY
jgi:hypothetical protein